MSSVQDLLKTSVSSFKAPPRFPAGNYIVVIDSYELLPFSWKSSGVHGLAYVPKIHAVSCIEADDDSNPDLQAQMLSELEAYGDWTARQHEFAYTSKETQKRMAQVAEINFPLLETDADHEEAVGILDKHAWRFYRFEDGTESGFVVDTLGVTDCQDDDILTLAEKTVGRKFMVNFDYEPNQDPSRPPNFTITQVSPA